MGQGSFGGIYFNYDESEFKKKMALLLDKQQKQFIKAAIRDSLRPLYNTTKKGAKASYNRKPGNKSRLSKPPEAGVQLKVGKHGDYGKVNLAGSYVLGLLELGTKPRYTLPKNKGKGKRKTVGKQQYRGQMQPKLFFTRARQAEEGNILKNFETKLSERIERLWNK